MGDSYGMNRKAFPGPSARASAFAQREVFSRNRAGEHPVTELHAPKNRAQNVAATVTRRIAPHRRFGGAPATNLLFTRACLVFVGMQCKHCAFGERPFCETRVAPYIYMLRVNALGCEKE